MSAAVAIENLVVAAGRRRLLDVPRLQLQPREAVALFGPNGAGKSTLLRVISGFQRPTHGQITTLGQPVGQLGRFGRARLRRRIGYVPQHLAAHSQLPLTVREVVAIGRCGRRGLLRALTAADHQHVDTLLGRLGIADLADQLYARLSGGEQRKALIARALVQEPELLLLDEPTANLDLGWREQIVALLDRAYAESGATLILVCHEPEVVPPCCQRLLFLEAGELMADDTPARVITDDRIRRLYGPGLTVQQRGARLHVAPAGDAN